MDFQHSNLENFVRVTSIRPTSPGTKLTEQDLDLQEQELLKSFLKLTSKPSKVHKKSINASMYGRPPSPSREKIDSHLFSSHKDNGIPLLSPRVYQSKDTPKTPSFQIQSFLNQIESQSKSDKILITRSTLTDIQKTLAALNRREKEHLLDIDMLSKTLEDIKSRQERQVKSHAFEISHLKETISSLNVALVQQKQASNTTEQIFIDQLKQENRRLKLDLFKEKIGRNNLENDLAEANEEIREMQQRLHEQIKMIAEKETANMKFKKIINFLSIE